MDHIFLFTYGMKLGGTERVLAMLANEFTRNGIRATIVTLIHEPCAYALDPAVTLVPLYQNEGAPPVRDYVRCFRRLRKLIRTGKPDLVLSMPEEVTGKAIPFLFTLGVPIVVSDRNNPWIMPVNRLNRVLRALFYRFASGFVFQTREAASFYSERIRKKSVIIPNPLELERLPPPWTGPRRKEVVAAGRLEEQKNFRLLIRAFAEFQKAYPDYSLTIYGEGSLKRELEEFARETLPAGSYALPGSTKELLCAMNGAAMFVLSSDYEGMPNVLIEAMALGLPCISTDCRCGPADLIEDGSSGLLVPVGDSGALSAAMKRVAASEALQTALGRGAMRVRDKLDAKKIIAQWRDYLKNVQEKESELHVRDGKKAR